MKIEFVQGTTHKRYFDIVVSHGKERNVFQDISLIRYHYDEEIGIFKEINAHWARRSEKDQKQLYSLYKAANVCIKAYNEIKDDVEAAETILITSLRPYVARILNMHHLPGVRAFLDNFYHDNVPDAFNGVVLEDSTHILMYTRDQYRMLQTALVIFRSIAPLIFMVRSVASHNVKALEDINKLLYRILFGKGVELMESEPLQKLESFIKECVIYFIGKENSSIDFDKVMSNLLLSRLFATDITGPYRNIVNNVVIYANQLTYPIRHQKAQ